MQVKLLIITAINNLFIGSFARVLFAYLAMSYIISGFLCYVYFLKYLFLHSKNSKLRLYVTALAGYWIVAFWPVWIIKETLSENSGRNKQ